MTIEDAARFLKVEKRQIYGYARRAKNPLPLIVINRITKRVNRQVLISWVEENEI